jgi:2-oxoglutarate ferredoxin oxidoreductase subunit alpha
MDEIIGHLREGVEFPDASELKIVNRKKPNVSPDEFIAYKVPEGEIVPPMPSFGEGYRFNITGLIHDETGFPTNNNAIAAKMSERLMKKIEDNADDIIRYEVSGALSGASGCDILILAYGGTIRSVKAAVKLATEAGIKAGVFRPITIWPFPEKAFKACVKDNNIKNVLVAELNYGQISLEAERILKSDAEVWHIGKIDGDILYPNEIFKKVCEVVKHG